jgi:hypothetical protein
MMDQAQRLGQGTDLVRADLYDLPGRIVFREPSSFHAGGGDRRSSPSPPRRYV